MRIDGSVSPACGAEVAGEQQEQAVLVTFAVEHPVPWPRRTAGADPALEELEDTVDRALCAAGVGELDGLQIRGTSVSLFAYGPDAERIWEAVRPAVLRYPHRSGTVTLRYGWCGAPTRSLPV
ncbi:hypothetical protein ACI8AC_04465 [Geodermatophilus sp. SYSU D00758]